MRREYLSLRRDNLPTRFFTSRQGKLKLTVTSDKGKAAVLAVLETGDFFGEGCLIGQPLRLAAATH
jgi:CRP/FNR family cyclic AMP-dependent transcriptional regulator